MIPSRSRLCVCVYVCLYAEWIKKLLINLIKSKSCVNIAQGGAIRTLSGAESVAQKDSYKFLKENK